MKKVLLITLGLTFLSWQPLSAKTYGDSWSRSASCPDIVRTNESYYLNIAAPEGTHAYEESAVVTSVGWSYQYNYLPWGYEAEVGTLWQHSRDITGQASGIDFDVFVGDSPINMFFMFAVNTPYNSEVINPTPRGISCRVTVNYEYEGPEPPEQTNVAFLQAVYLLLLK